MQLEAVLDFVRTTDEATWSLLYREIANTRLIREQEAAEGFCIGNRVIFRPPDGEACEGFVLKINRRRGRIMLACCSSADRVVERSISVPASMVTKCAETSSHG